MAIAGFSKWSPGDESLAIYRDAQAVFEEYKDYLPLTGRQVFYRLVAAYGWEKSDAFANKLYNVLGRARRAGWLPFTHLRDGGGSKQLPQVWDDEADFWAGVRDDFRHYSRNRQAGQEVFVELFCEAPGMMPQLVRAAFPYSVPVYGTRGYTGLSVISDVVKRVLERDTPTTILQIGDLDPSGVGIYETLRDDVEAFVLQAVHGIGKDKPGLDALVRNFGISRKRVQEIREASHRPAVGFERIALTWEQVDEYDLPTAPPSHKDSRTRNWPYDDTAQAEALPPDLLQQIAREGIEAQLDMDRYQEEVDLEAADEDEIERKLDEVAP